MPPPRSLEWLSILACGLLVACHNTGASPAVHEEAPFRLDVRAPGVAPGPEPVPPASAQPYTTSRTITRDDDADGVDDYRAVITESFDGAGNLRSRTKAQDFDADGIIDSQVTTRFGSPDR